MAREYEFALAVKLCPRQCGSSPTGANRASPAVAAHPVEFARGESVESHLGGYGLYYRSPLRTLGLVAAAGTLLGESPTPVDVLIPTSTAAKRLAATFADSVGGTRYVVDYIDSDEMRDPSAFAGSGLSRSTGPKPATNGLRRNRPCQPFYRASSCSSLLATNQTGSARNARAVPGPSEASAPSSA